LINLVCYYRRMKLFKFSIFALGFFATLLSFADQNHQRGGGDTIVISNGEMTLRAPVTTTDGSSEAEKFTQAVTGGNEKILFYQDDQYFQTNPQLQIEMEEIISSVSQDSPEFGKALKDKLEAIKTIAIGEEFRSFPRNVTLEPKDISVFYISFDGPNEASTQKTPVLLLSNNTLYVNRALFSKLTTKEQALVLTNVILKSSLNPELSHHESALRMLTVTLSQLLSQDTPANHARLRYAIEACQFSFAQ